MVLGVPILKHFKVMLFLLCFSVPSPPENLLAEVVSPGTVRLQWGPPRKQNGIIRFYIIYYNVDKDQPEQVWSSIQQNGKAKEIEDVLRLVISYEIYETRRRLVS